MESISEVEDVGEKEPEDEKKGPSIHYWLSQLNAYDRAAESWKRDVDSAWDEYLNEDGRGKSNQSRKATTHFPLFWSCVRTIQPAFYSRTPIIVTEKTFEEMQDPIARLGAIMLERLGKYCVKTSCFDRSMALAVTHFIMAEKASVRVLFEAALAEDQQNIEYVKCETEPMHYKDYRQTPNARHEGEIDWKSFDTLMTRTEVEETFGEDVAKELTYTPVGDNKDKERNKEIQGLPARYATITEIWDKKKRKVYYLCKGYNEWLKHNKNPTGDDPYQLKDFFPCAPFMMGTYGSDDMFTVPAYIQLQDFIEQVHGAFDRIRRQVLALKKCGVFDASKPELAELNAIADEGQFIGIDDLDTLLGPNGTLESLIHFFPTDKIAQGVIQLKEAMKDLEQKVYDLWGIPDIYRGITDPNETLGAQQLKGKHMSVRFSVLQRDVQRLARDTIEIMCDLMLAKCPDMKLAEIMGFRFMEPQSEQPIFGQALALIKNDTERCIRIDIETDSTITQDMNADIEQKNYLAKTLFEGVASLKDLNPIFLPVAAKSVEIAVGALKEGKQITGELHQSLQTMLQQAANPPPPPPDPELMKIQGRMQIEQQHAQAQIQIEQQKTAAQIQQDQLLAQNQMALDQQQGAIDAQIAKMKSELEMLKMQHQMQIEQQNAAIDAELRRREHEYDVMIKEMELQAKTKLALVESLIDKMQKAESEGGGIGGGKSAPARLRIETGKAPRVARIQRGDDGSVTVMAEDVE